MGREDFYYLPTITMTTNNMVQECTTPTTHSTSRVKSLVTAMLLGLSTIVASTDIQAQTKDPTLADTSKNEQPKQKLPEKKGSFFMDPTYSPNDEVGTVRLRGGGSVHGVGMSGFLDLTGTPDNHADVSSAFGKLEMTKSTDKVVKGTALDIQYVLVSGGHDKVRGGARYKIALPDGTVVVKVFPISDKGFDPDVLVGINQSIDKHLAVGAFISTNLKAESYYGEAEATYKVSKSIYALAQMRVGGTYTSKPKAGAYLGLRAKIQ